MGATPFGGWGGGWRREEGGGGGGGKGWWGGSRGFSPWKIELAVELGGWARATHVWPERGKRGSVGFGDPCRRACAWRATKRLFFAVHPGTCTCARAPARCSASLCARPLDVAVCVRAEAGAGSERGQLTAQQQQAASSSSSMYWCTLDCRRASACASYWRRLHAASNDARMIIRLLQPLSRACDRSHSRRRVLRAPLFCPSLP